MKILINRDYGGFGVKKEFLQAVGLDNLFHDEDIKIRTNPQLIEWVEQGINIGESYSDLVVYEIPKEATDYYIEDYDGFEKLMCVLNGKIHWL